MFNVLKLGNKYYFLTQERNNRVNLSKIDKFPLNTTAYVSETFIESFVTFAFTHVPLNEFNKNYEFSKFIKGSRGGFIIVVNELTTNKSITIKMAKDGMSFDSKPFRSYLNYQLPSIETITTFLNSFFKWF